MPDPIDKPRRRFLHDATLLFGSTGQHRIIKFKPVEADPRPESEPHKVAPQPAADKPKPEPTPRRPAAPPPPPKRIPNHPRQPFVDALPVTPSSRLDIAHRWTPYLAATEPVFAKMVEERGWPGDVAEATAIEPTAVVLAAERRAA